MIVILEADDFNQLGTLPFRGQEQQQIANVALATARRSAFKLKAKHAENAIGQLEGACSVCREENYAARLRDLSTAGGSSTKTNQAAG